MREKESVTLSTRISRKIDKVLDRLVEEGYYTNKAEIMRSILRDYIRSNHKSYYEEAMK